jgi:exopolysaccharide biosynthesis predicted pyruvyltransferase EpsI
MRTPARWRPRPAMAGRPSRPTRFCAPSVQPRRGRCKTPTMTVQPIDKIQADTLAELAKHIPQGSRVAMLDFPMHLNAGDSFIYLGQRAYMDRLGVETTYVADFFRFSGSDLRERTDGPILLPGGGALGDTWDLNQDFRERVVAECHDRPVVQLPQSIHFRSKARAERARRVFEAHPDFTLMVRDHQALEVASRLFPDTKTVYCPDMAFGLGMLTDSKYRNPEVDIVRLLRQDAELIAGQEAVLPPRASSRTTDWGLSTPRMVAWRGLRLPGQVARHVPATGPALLPLVQATYDRIARLSLNQAMKTLGRGRLVVTNRLHAAVLAGLMGIPFVALDNSYGKISAVFTDYLHKLPGANFAATPSELADTLDLYFNR